MTTSPLADLSTPRTTYVRPLDLILVAVVTAAVFMPNLYGLLSPLDDITFLSMTSQFKTPSWDGYWQFWINPPFRIFMPLTMTVWQFIAHFEYRPELEPDLSAMGTIGFKAASILAHTFAAAAATWVISLITKSRLPAVIGGLVFALHPVQVESVCWTTGLKDELCGLFAFLSIGFYFSFLHDDLKFPWKSWRWYAAFVAALLSMLSKPTGMMIPASLLTIDFLMRRAPLVRRLPSLWAFFVPAVLCGILAHLIQRFSNVPQVPVWARPLVAGDTVAFYLYKIAIPFRLAQDYGRHPQLIWQNGQIWWTWLLPAALLIVLVMRRDRLMLLAAALFVIPIAPVSGLVPFDMQQYSTPCDHYLFQPMLGVGLFVSLLLCRQRSAVNIVAIILVTGLGILSWHSAREWRRPRLLFEDLLRKNPKSWMAQSILAGLSSAAGDTAYATKVANELLAERPTSGLYERQMSFVRFHQGQYREAADFARQAFKFGVDDQNLARSMMECGAILHDRDLAYDGVTTWLRLDPGNPKAAKVFSDIRRSMAADKRAATARQKNGDAHEAGK